MSAIVSATREEFGWMVREIFMLPNSMTKTNCEINNIPISPIRHVRYTPKSRTRWTKRRNRNRNRNLSCAGPMLKPIRVSNTDTDNLCLQVAAIGRPFGLCGCGPC